MLSAVVLLQGPGARTAKETILGAVGVTTWSQVCAGHLRFDYAREFKLLTLEIVGKQLHLADSLKIFDGSPSFDDHAALLWISKPEERYDGSPLVLASTHTLAAFTGVRERLAFAAHVMGMMGLPVDDLRERIRNTVDP